MKNGMNASRVNEKFMFFTLKVINFNCEHERMKSGMNESRMNEKFMFFHFKSDKF